MKIHPWAEKPRPTPGRYVKLETLHSGYVIGHEMLSLISCQKTWARGARLKTKGKESLRIAQLNDKDIFWLSLFTGDGSKTDEGRGSRELRVREAGRGGGVLIPTPIPIPFVNDGGVININGMVMGPRMMCNLRACFKTISPSLEQLPLCSWSFVW